MSDWRPIDTAPSDGRIIIVWWSGPSLESPNPRWARWQTHPNGPHPSMERNITHWMPDIQPPEPPA